MNRFEQVTKPGAGQFERTRSRLQKAGVENPSEALSVTGFDEKKIRAAKMGVPLEHIDTVAKIIGENGSPEMVPLARTLGVPYHALPGAYKVMSNHGWGAFAELHDRGAHLGKKQRTELVLSKAKEGLLSTLDKAESVGLKGDERYEAAAAIDRTRRYHENMKEIKDALRLGVPPNYLERWVSVIRDDASEKAVIAQASKTFKDKGKMEKVLELIDKFGATPVSEAIRMKTPFDALKHMTIAIHGSGSKPVERALALGTPYHAVHYPARLLMRRGKDGESLLLRMYEYGIPPDQVQSAEDLFTYKREGFLRQAKQMNVNDHNIVPVARHMLNNKKELGRAIMRRLPPEKLSEAAGQMDYRDARDHEYVGLPIDFVHFASPKKDWRIIVDTLKKAGERTQATGKPISRKKLLQISRESGLTYSAFKAFGNAQEYTAEGLEEVRSRAKMSLAADRIRKRDGVSLFACNVAIYPHSREKEDRNSRTMVIYPPSEEIGKLAKQGITLMSGKEEDAVASVRFHKKGSTLYITQLQSGFRPDTPKEFVDKYRGWKEAALYLLKGLYADQNGIRRICITPTEYQVEKAELGINPLTAIETYTKFPSRQKFKLVHEPELELEYRSAPLVWSKRNTKSSPAFRRLLSLSMAHPNKVKNVE